MNSLTGHNPSMAEVYRQRIAQLYGALQDPGIVGNGQGVMASTSFEIRRH